MKRRPREEKRTEAAEILADSGLETYIRSSDGAVMVEIAPNSFLSADHLWLASGRRITGQNGLS